MIGTISGVGYRPYGYAVSPYAAQKQTAQTARTAPEQAGSWAVQRRSALETPVQPVNPVRAVSADEASVPALLSRMENDPAAMAGRMRVQYGDITPEGLFVETGKDAVQGARLANLEGRLSQAEDALENSGREPLDPALKNAAASLSNAPQETQDAAAPDGSQGVEGAQKALEEGECQTCKERKYQDGSDDPGVSFKTPTNIAPEQAASAVRGHEMEHVYREQAKAEREDRKVVSQTVTMHTAICPECGKSYVSGGTTRTTTMAKAEQADPAQKTEEDNQARTPFSAVA